MKAFVPVILAASVAAAQTGTVYARSTPPGARVYVDGSQTPSGTTPTVLRGLTPGKHRLRFAFPGGGEVLREVTVEANKLVSMSVSVSEAGKPVAPAAPGGGAVVNVVSDPPGAELAVDGKLVGKTPCAARDLSAGTHKFVLTKKDYTDYETSLQLEPGETRLLQAKLEPASPGARPVPKTSGVPKKIQKNCPLCEGKGHMQVMGCPACKRTGLTREFNQCAKCGGAATIAATCARCRGNGVVRGEACPKCGGSGKPNCPKCKGKGKVEVDNPDYYKDKYDILTCPHCGGSGVNDRFRCGFCKGQGTKRLTYSSMRGGFQYRRTVKCWFCEGKGEALPPCAQCAGLGYLGNQYQAVACPRCGGTGKTRVKCGGCKGNGWKKKRKFK